MVNEQHNTTDRPPRFEQWSGLIDLGLLFFAAMTWTSTTVALVLIALLFRRWSLLGLGVLVLLNVEHSPLLLQWVMPCTAHLTRDTVTSSQRHPAEPSTTVAEDVAREGQEPVDGVAKPQNGENALLLLALEAAKVEALAAIMKEAQRQPFVKGEVPETRVIKAIFGYSPSAHAGSPYQRVKKQLAELLTDSASQSRIDPITGVTEDGRVIRTQADGREYVIDAATRERIFL